MVREEKTEVERARNVQEVCAWSEDEMASGACGGGTARATSVSGLRTHDVVQHAGQAVNGKSR